VSVAALGLSSISDSFGQFNLPGVTLQSAVFTVTVVIQAAGYGTWTLAGARLVANDTLLLTAPVDREAMTISVAVPRAQLPEWPAGAMMEPPASPVPATPSAA